MGAEYDSMRMKAVADTKESRAALNEAFNDYVKQSQYEHGHGGYTGTFAEHSSFRFETITLKNPSSDELFVFCEGSQGSKWNPPVAIFITSEQFTGWYIGGWCSS